MAKGPIKREKEKASLSLVALLIWSSKLSGTNPIATHNGLLRRMLRLAPNGRVSDSNKIAFMVVQRETVLASRPFMGSKRLIEMPDE